MYLLCVNIIMTFRHTYSSIRSFTLLNMRVTCVIFSTITPTSCRSWSIVMGLPIIEDRQFCSIHRFWNTCGQSSFNMKYIVIVRIASFKVRTSWWNSESSFRSPFILVEFHIFWGPCIAWYAEVVNTSSSCHLCVKSLVCTCKT